MICMKDAAMNVVHISPEWHGFTGMEVSSAKGRGWLAAVHADDRSLVDHTLQEAARRRSGYSVDYRLMHRSGAAIWVSDCAVASMSPEDGSFLGLLGSITEISSLNRPTVARSRIGEFRPPPPMPSTLTALNPDLMTDYLLLARAIADQEGEGAILETVDFALYLTRKRFDRSVH